MHHDENQLWRKPLRGLRPTGTAATMLMSCFVVGAFVACSGEPSPTTTPTAPNQTVVAQDQTSTPASEAVTDATAPVAPVPITSATPPAGDEASFMGYGDARFGMIAAQVRQALDGSLREQNDPANACYFLQPKEGRGPPYFTLMFEGGKFVRYDVGNDEQSAPGGGKRGMSSEQLDALYRGALQDAPHKFVKGGKYRAIAASGVAPSKLVFKTDAAGVVTEWHVGVSPQVDYREACESSPNT